MICQSLSVMNFTRCPSSLRSRYSRTNSACSLLPLRCLLMTFKKTLAEFIPIKWMAYGFFFAFLFHSFLGEYTLYLIGRFFKRDSTAWIISGLEFATAHT